MTQKKLTIREERFVEEMANPKIKSQTEAAVKAGYSRRTARSIANENLTKPDIRTAIEARRKRALSQTKATPEEVIGAAVFQMRSSIDDVLDEKGSFCINRARETGVIDLIKKMEIKTIIDAKTGNQEITHKIEMHSNQDARKEVANYMGLEKAPQQQANSFTDEDLAKELYKRMVANRGYSPEEVLEAIKGKFPELDVTTIIETVM